MIASHEKNVKSTVIKAEGYANIRGKVLISAASGWEDYVMRLFEVMEDGYSGDHSHDYPHIVYVLEGKGDLYLEGEKLPIEKGSFAFIANGQRHQLKNSSNKGEVLKFICIVPKEGHLGFDD